MGYPTKRVKVRRYNRHLRLHAMVALAGVHIHTFATVELRTGKKGTHTEIYKDGFRYYSLAHNNKFTAVQKCAELLPLENGWHC